MTSDGIVLGAILLYLPLYVGVGGVGTRHIYLSIYFYNSTTIACAPACKFYIY